MNNKIQAKKIEQIVENDLNKIHGGSVSYIDQNGVSKFSDRELSPTDPAKKGKKITPPSGTES